MKVYPAFWVLLVLLVLLVLGAASTASAEEATQKGSPFAVDLKVDLPLTGGALVTSLLPELFKAELRRPSCVPMCDPAQVNPLDRTVIGNRSREAELTSDVFLAASIGLPIAFDLIDVLATKPPDRFAGFGKDVLVLAETFAINLLINNTIKFAVGRVRPLGYDNQVEMEKRLDPDAGLSFYSGHSSTTFAMATAYSYLFMKRHPGSKMIVPVWILAEGLAASTAYLRVHAGKHFWTDILTGAAIGTAIGLLCPYLHDKARRNQIQLAPMATPSTIGVSLSLVR